MNNKAVTDKKTKGKFGNYYLIGGGIILPIITLVFEINTHGCAQTFFNPIPSFWHIIFILIVPLSNLGTIWVVQKKQYQFIRKMLFVNGMAMGVAFFYTLLFLPITPIAIIGIMWMGIGMLPLAPLFSLIATFIGRRCLIQVADLEKSFKIVPLWRPMVCALFVLILIEIPQTLTHLGLQMVISQNKNMQQSGLSMLRSIGDKDLMLSLCYPQWNRPKDIISYIFPFKQTILPRTAQVLFFKVFGEGYNTVEPPSFLTSSGFRMWSSFDSGIGNQEVAGKVEGLSLATSIVDGSIDPIAALSYLEWTLEFKNETQFQQEARMQMVLPPNGVVSRLTLWVDGEEREAAFAAKRKVVDAYKKVVNKKRDPVLVTIAGPDRVMVQCFPVPAGDVMKIRIGITSPLELMSMSLGRLFMPTLVAHNFEIPSRFLHAVWIESQGPIAASSSDLIDKTASESDNVLRGNVRQSDIEAKRLILDFERSSEQNQAWAFDPLSEKKFIVHQTLDSHIPTRPKHIIFVIDGSYYMGKQINEIIKALDMIPQNVLCGLVLAGDVSKVLAKPQDGRDIFGLALKSLQERNFIGGCDNVPALVLASELAARFSTSTIVWIHGPQPVVMESSARPVSYLKKRQIHLVDLQLTLGVNHVLENQEIFHLVQTIPFTGQAGVDLKWYINRQFNSHPQATRQYLQADMVLGKSMGHFTSNHLAKLWANEQVNRLFTSPQQKYKQAIALAIEHQIVTLLTGAVVLENQSQYDEAGLTPVDPKTVPTIPEPELIVLIGVVLSILILSVLKNRKVSKWETS